LSPSILRPLCAVLAAFLLTGCLFEYPVPSPVETTAEAPEDVEDPEEEEDPSYMVICVRKQTRIRVAYRPCDDAEPGFAWYFTPMEGKVPATGRKVKGGSFEDPGYEGSRARARGGPGYEAAVRSKDRVEVCVKQRTRIRTADSRCDDFDEGFAWYRIPLDGYVPALGKKAEGGSFYFTGSEELRARKKGGEAAKAVIRSDEPGDNMSTRAPVCTWTTNGRCNNGNTANGCGHSSFNRVCGYGRGPVRP
jgi:hypothetical protein